MNILVTGSAGFIGMHTAETLLARGDTVIGFDNLNDYYDVSLKHARLTRLQAHPNYIHITADLADRAAVEAVFAAHTPQRVIHLAAQAGVRYSKENPHVYADSNLTGFLHILEGCRHHGVEHLVYASTSSAYGGNTKMPYTETESTEHPLTFYAATKKANEMMAHCYAHQYGLPCTGLRFFTVYGPWGRPDMAFFSFTKAILEGRPIPVFNYGKHTRDFTFVSDIVDGVIRACDRPATPNADWNGDAPDPASSTAPYRIYNIGSGRNTQLLRYIELLEQAIGRKAEMELMPMMVGDVPDTWASVDALHEATGYTPATPVEVGVPAFVDWYRSFYKV
ncbi:NAD-dependent epimerase [Arenimonas maotaiensis]|uniref:NAD-dependent epimerase n=1 Tax=Arenimonas maotaiensis TaxID=1446479 RepID=A0A917CHW7_9GAMM|nr:NAD-dependent epimerase [Arenimonas maotaiensis]GGF86278.1 NAD-dependent epimerase [Arenimonas maotaiensis]